MLWLMVWTPKSPIPGIRNHHLTQCVLRPKQRICQTTSESIKQFKQSSQM